MSSRLLLTPGRARGLQQCALAEGVFAILAADHRDAMRVLINREQPQKVPAEHLTALKLAIVRHLAPEASAVLLDPLYGAGQAIAAGVLPGGVGLVVAWEEQGYLGDPYGRQTTLLAGWGAEKARRLGAAAVKLLLFYHPDAGPVADRQERLVAAVLAECRRYDLPLLLEPIAYPLQRDRPKDGPHFARERRRVVIESARRLSALGPDVLKVEFPLDVNHDPDPGLWAEACAELDAATAVPWVLLSAGEPFETFCQQLTVACQAGCAGFAAGRSLWGEAATLSAAAREAFLATTARERLRRLVGIVRAQAHPWHERYTVPMPDERWYQTY
jgi:tagatose-1,6-bisphosphate aldolase